MASNLVSLNCEREKMSEDKIYLTEKYTGLNVIIILHQHPDNFITPFLVFKNTSSSKELGTKISLSRRDPELLDLKSNSHINFVEKVQKFISLNFDALAHYWKYGDEMDEEEIQHLKDNLTKI